MAQGDSCVLRAGALVDILKAGAEFTEFILQTAFGSKKNMTVQAYVSLDADAGGEAIKKEIGADLDYFSVNIQLGVSTLSLNLSVIRLSAACLAFAVRRHPENPSDRFYR